MTNEKPNLAPGCFGSAVMLRPDAPECVACIHGSTCSATVKRTQRDALVTVDRLSKLLDCARTDEVARWWSGRWNTDKRAQRSQERVSSVLEKWTSDGLNPQLLRHRINPVKKDEDAVAYDAFDFMIEARAFKPRDVVEHLRDNHPELSKALLEKRVKQTCEALLSIQVLHKEGHVLCL